MEYCSAMKRNKPLTQATNWMNLKGITVSRRSQSQYVTYGMILYV